MNKNTQIKVILIFFVCGVIIVSLIGSYYTKMLKQLDKIVTEEYEIIEQIENQTFEIRVIIIMYIFVYIAVTILVLIFASKSIISPMNSLEKKVEKLAKGEEVENIEIENIDSQVLKITNSFNEINNELKERLNDVNRQKNQIETILIHLKDGIIAFSKEKEIIHINLSAKKILGIDEEVNIIKILEILKIEEQFSEKMDIYETNNLLKQINDKYVNIVFAPYNDEKDTKAGVIMVLQDITKQVELDNMRKEFVADVSHELKTPITSIMGYSETLLNTQYNKEINNKFLKVILEESKRMSKLVSELLILSKYDNNSLNEDKTFFSIKELIEICINNVKNEINKKNQNLVFYIQDSIPKYEASIYALERAITNIILNSVKYTKEQGIININVKYENNTIKIEIKDNGKGIPKEDLSKIFERFYRVEKARTRELGGTGLGLSIAKEIIQKNNGIIEIESEVGKGTTVTLIL